MARRRPSLHRIRLLVVAVSTVFQLPALALLSRYGRRLGTFGALLPYALAVAITLPHLVVMLKKPFVDQPKPAWLRRLFLRPFFMWWSTSALFLVLGTVTASVAWATQRDGSTAAALALGLSAIGGLWSVARGPRLIELDVDVPGLSAQFDGYRIGQISDIHCGSFTHRNAIERWAATLNAARPDLIAVTGDLITSGDAFTEDVAAALSTLVAPDGVYACMGNHDYFCDAERLVAALREGGLKVLRNEGEHIERDGARLYVAGVEDKWTSRDDLTRTLAARDGATTLLLAHDPNHFTAAVAAGVELQLSGHTHGGQLAFPGAGGRYNLARLITRYTNGLFSDGRSRLYVSRGAGTTGPPVRLFAPAELTILRLRAT